MKKAFKLLSTVLLVLLLASCASPSLDLNQEIQVVEHESYSTKEELALYIHSFDKLPKNFLTKSQARELGWDASMGNLWEVSDKMSIGGDSFGNREKLLPEASKRRYFEADVNYQGGYRGPERLVYSSDGLIFYTSDHYDSFEQLYGRDHDGKSSIGWTSISKQRINLPLHKKKIQRARLFWQ